MAAPVVTPLELAIWRQDVAAVEKLLSDARQQDKDRQVVCLPEGADSTVLPRAQHVRFGHSVPLTHGTTLAELVNRIGPSGEPPLLLAARTGQTGVCRLLIEAGADLRIREKKGWRALYTLLPFLKSDPGLVLRAVELSAHAEEGDVLRRLEQVQVALASLPDFEASMTVGWTTWVPMLGRVLPSDTLRIVKIGKGLRIDFSLCGLTQSSTGLHLPTWKRGRLSFVLTPPEAEGAASGRHGRIWVLDHVKGRAADVTLSELAERRLRRMHHLGQVRAGAGSESTVEGTSSQHTRQDEPIIPVRSVAEARQHRSLAVALGEIAATAAGASEGQQRRPRASSAWWWMTGSQAEGVTHNPEVELEMDLEHAALHLVSAGWPNVDTWSREHPKVTPQMHRARSRMAAPVDLLRSVFNRVRRRSRGGSAGGTEEVDQSIPVGSSSPSSRDRDRPFIDPVDANGMIQTTTTVGTFTTCKVWAMTGLTVVVNARPAMQKGAVEQWEAQHHVRTTAGGAHDHEAGGTGEAGQAYIASTEDAAGTHTGRLAGRLPGRRTSRTLASFMSTWLGGGREVTTEVGASTSTTPTPRTDVSNIRQTPAAAAAAAIQRPIAVVLEEASGHGSPSHQSAVVGPANALTAPNSPSAASASSAETAGELTLLVPARSTEQCTCTVKQGDRLTWSISVDGSYDIGVQIDWAPVLPAAPSHPALSHVESAELQGAVTIRAYAKVNSDTGTFTAPCAGTVLVDLDNSYSLVHRKKVWTSLDVDKAGRTVTVPEARGTHTGVHAPFVQLDVPPAEDASLHAEDAAVEQERSALAHLLAHASGTHIAGSLLMRSKRDPAALGRLQHHPLVSTILDGCSLSTARFEEYFRGCSVSTVRAQSGLTAAQLPDGSSVVVVTPPTARTLSRTLTATVATAPYGEGPGQVPFSLALPHWYPIISALAPSEGLYQDFVQWIETSFPGLHAGFPVAVTFPIMPALGMAAVLQVTHVTVLRQSDWATARAEGPQRDSYPAEDHRLSVSVPGHYCDVTEEYVFETFFVNAGAA